MKNGDSRETPQFLFEYLNQEYRFTMDVACTELNRKVKRYLQDSLRGVVEWRSPRIFCNPPYSNILPWLEKGLYECILGNCDIVVYVLPQDLSTTWGEFCRMHASKIILLTGGRVQFLTEGIKSSSNPKGTLIVVFDRFKEEIDITCVALKSIK